MKLTDIWSSKAQIDDTNKTQVESAGKNSLINRQIRSLAPGQTIQGEVVARSGSEVQIRVSDDMIIKAKVDGNINLEVGKNMTFEVKNNGSNLTLSPLYANTATDANVLKALEMASLPVNEDTIYMTEEFMRAGLSIDRNSLQQVFRESNLFTQSNISDIVDLHKLALPVNEENLSQVASYKNMTHQLVSGLQDVINTTTGAIGQMVQNGDLQGAATVYQELLQMIAGPENSVELNEDISAQAKQIFAEDASQYAAEEIRTDNITGSPQAVAKELLTILQNSARSQVYADLCAQLEQLAESEQMVNLGQNPEPEQMQGAEQTVNLGQNLQPGQMQEAEQMTGYGQMLEQMAEGNRAESTTGQLAAMIGRILQQGMENKDGRILQGILSNQEVAVFVKTNLQHQWSISPREVADAKQVEEFYEKLDRQLKGLTQALEHANQTGKEAHSAVTNLNRNLDFLQQLNQTYTYLQLPLRLQQGNQAHGDLYVYTNKKHLASSEGQITALLHLDMEHLGPVDVYVAMQNEKVNTKFYLQDEEMLDFLYAHIDILTERLQKRGYHISCEMQTREEDKEQEKDGIIGKLLAKENHIPIVQYAFDVRT